MKLLVFCCLVGVALSGTWKEMRDVDFTNTEYIKNAFNEWRNEFGREYDDITKEVGAFRVFVSNWKMVVDHNKLYDAGESSFYMQLNQFSDLEGDDFLRYIHGSTQSCLSKRESEPENGYYDPSLAFVNVPDSVDWTTEGVVTPVKNQGQCGSCWAFSTTGSIECRTAIKTGKLVSLSEQQLMDCSFSEGNLGCSGGLMDNAFKYVEKEGGLCTEAEYPYKAKDGLCKASSCGTVYDEIRGYVDVTTKSSSSLQAAVAQGCVSVAIEADQSSFQFYRGGILDGNCGTSLDHGVLVVGYGSDGGKDYWKVKNSWGASWGEDGYVRVCRNCDKNGKNGECGILDQPSYPTI